MKHLNLLVVLLSISITSFAQRAGYNHENIIQYVAPSQNCVQIPSSFADNHLQEKSNLTIPKEKKITQIDLVYTRFKANPKFNQQQLNNARIAQLKKMYPKIAADNPRWNWVEQTGATTAEEASTYFHGFVIHYDEPASFHALKSYFNDQGNLPNQFTVDNKTGGDFNHSSGSVIHVPANCVTYKNGEPVKGKYTIAYTEYRNAAEIAFSGLPMTYKNNQGEYNFSSVGMYEIRGSQNGKELQLNQPITVDFHCTEVAQGVDFYELDDQTGDWKQTKTIDFAQQNASNSQLRPDLPKEIPVQEIGKPRLNVQEEQAIVENKKLVIETTHSNGKSTSTFSDEAWKYYLEVKKDDPEFIQTAVISENTSKKQVVVTREAAEELTERTFNKQVIPGFHNGSFQNNMANTLLAEGSTDPGHTYPALVRGLNSPSFGVYNCDQIYQLTDQISLTPTYIDQETGKEIKSGHVACVVNLKINGSYSFSPKVLSCSKSADQVILLFTDNKEVYALSSEKWKALSDKKQGNITLEMDNITSSVKTSDDLKTYLGI